MLEAEALVWRFGSRGVAIAQVFALASLSETRRTHYRRVARAPPPRAQGPRCRNPVLRVGALAAPPRIDDPMMPFRFGRLPRTCRGVSASRLGATVFVVSLTLSVGYADSGAADNTETFSGRVTRVVDGDTFWISSASERVRVWGLDAPERNDVGGSAATEAFAAF
jgi:hypothetical protein